MTRYLIDTNVLSELARPRPNPKVAAWMRKLSRVSLSAITVEEVEFGLSSRPNARVSRWFESFYEQFCDVLPVTSEIARSSGRLRGALRSRGLSRTQADVLIAATAIHHGLAVVTHNVRDFEDCGILVIDPFV